MDRIRILKVMSVDAVDTLLGGPIDSRLAECDSRFHGFFIVVALLSGMK